nr:unnamed protein product [Callosobruchus analis]
MKVTALLLGFVLYVSGVPQQDQYQEPIPILRQDQEIDFDGSYNYG